MVVKRFFCSFVAVVCIALITGCSDDNDEPMVEGVIAPEVVEPIPEPDWVDGTITIEIGRFNTAEEILNAIERKGYFTGYLMRDDVTMNGGMNFPGQKRSVEISVISMLEVGLDKPVILREIQTRFRERGYRPLTFEEALELRLQFYDQPDVSSGHKMSAFYLLPSEKDTLTLGGGVTEHLGILNRYIWMMYHFISTSSIHQIPSDEGEATKGITGHILRGYQFNPYAIDPLSLESDRYRVVWGEERLQGTWFACVKKL